MMANKTLRILGIQPNEKEIPLTIESTLPSRHQSPDPVTEPDFFSKDPLLSIQDHDIYHALEVYKEELHPIYPFLPLEDIQIFLPVILDRLDRGLDPVCVGNEDTQPALVDSNNVRIMKMIVASVWVLDRRGKSDFAQHLVDDVERKLNASTRLVEVNIQELQILTMIVSSSYSIASIVS